MKKYLITTFILCFTIRCIAQENFEGVIKYDMNIEDLSHATWFSFKVYYKQHKILVKAFSGDDSTIAEHENLLDYDSGFSYEINTDEHRILKDSLNKAAWKAIIPVMMNDSIKNFLNYACKLAKIDSVNINDEHYEDVSIWFAEELKFKLPENYFPFSSGSLFINGKNICLSAWFSTVIYRYANARMNMKAVMINRTSLPDSLFSLPKNFSISQRPSYSTTTKLKITSIKSDGSPPSPLPPPPPPFPSAKKKAGKKITVTTKSVKTTSTKGKQ